VVSGKSSDSSELKILGEEENENENVQDDDDDDDDDSHDLTQPLRIGTMHMMFEARLTGSSSNLRKNLSSRSGSESPLHHRGGNSSSHSHNHTFDGGSSISSLEDQGIDTDILTDKMGNLELNLKAQQEIAQRLHKSLSNLPAVNERLRDETLEDCHAFTDLKREGTGSLSRGGSITTGGEVTLEPLEEIGEEDVVDGPNDNDNERTSKIKITNLAEILEGPDEEETGETAASI